MNLLIDINVILDVVLAREPWAGDSAHLLSEIDRRGGEINGFVASHSLPTIYYIVNKERDRPSAIAAVTDLLKVVDVAPLDASDFHVALAFGLSDFEDAVQIAAALKVEAEYVVTRNPRDYRGSPVALRSPGEILAMFRD